MGALLLFSSGMLVLLKVAVVSSGGNVMPGREADGDRSQLRGADSYAAVLGTRCTLNGPVARQEFGVADAKANIKKKNRARSKKRLPDKSSCTAGSFKVSAASLPHRTARLFEQSRCACNDCSRFCISCGAFVLRCVLQCDTGVSCRRDGRDFQQLQERHQYLHTADESEPFNARARDSHRGGPAIPSRVLAPEGVRRHSTPRLATIDITITGTSIVL
jgi:hypothetical protein